MNSPKSVAVLPDSILKELMKLNVEERKKLIERLKDPNEKLSFFSEEDKTYYKIS